MLNRRAGHATSRAHVPVDARGAVAVPINVLLVTNSQHWMDAVRDAAAQLGVSDVARCGARDALARLTLTGEHYSHVLVEQDYADGLLDDLMSVTAQAGENATEMLLLGNAGTTGPRVGVIHDANGHSVRDALTLWQSSREALETRMNLTELRAALDSARIETRYQPIVRMADRQPIALEALARLNHPLLGTLLPDRFVPQMEDAGLAAQLTELVSARALGDMVGPSLMGGSLLMTLNFPLDVLLHPVAIACLEAQRAAAGIPADRIVVELTESRPVSDMPGLRRALDRLRADGFQVAIDDVGPAVPRLAPLLEMPFTRLKLDKDVVKHVEKDAQAAGFLRQTIDQAHAHGMRVVAEGVETVRIWNLIRAMGADEAQGFAIARPLPITAVPIWVEAWEHATAFD